MVKQRFEFEINFTFFVNTSLEINEARNKFLYDFRKFVASPDYLRKMPAFIKSITRMSLGESYPSGLKHELEYDRRETDSLQSADDWNFDVRDGHL